jgi:hypothetical protein
VTSQDAVDRLLQTPTGFRLYGVQPEPAASISTVLVPATAPAAPSGNIATAKPEASPYVLVSGDSTFDLRPLTDAELFEFVKVNAIPDVHPNSKGDTIRNKIVAFLKAPE